MAERRLVMHPQSDVKPKKIHDLIKAPANLPWALEKKQSWNANDLATVYHTPETLSDGTPTQAVTVILRTKDAIGGGHQDVLFADISMIQETM